MPGAALLVPLPSSGRAMKATLNKRRLPSECHHLGAATCSLRQELLNSSCNIDVMSCRAAWLELVSLLGSGSLQVWGFSLSLCLQ